MARDKALEKAYEDLLTGAASRDRKWSQHEYVTTHVSNLTTQARNAKSRIYAAGRNRAAEIRALKENDTMYPAGKARRVQEAQQAAKREIEEAYKESLALAGAIRAELFDAALPKLAPDREMAARDEFRMLLDGSQDPETLLVALARGDNELAGLAVSRYAESYLRARGRAPMDAKTYVHSARLTAIDAAPQRSDPQIRAAAEAYHGVGELEGAALCAKGTAEFDLNDALSEPDASTGW